MADNNGNNNPNNTDDNGNDGNEIIIDEITYQLNDKGDAIDDKGIIIKTKDEIATLLASNNNLDEEEIELDGKVYKLDKTGNAIDETGKVFKTKGDIDKLIELSENELNFTNLHKVVNIEILDENGNPVTYEDTPKGIAQYINDVAELRERTATKEYASNFLKSNPDIEDMLRYKVLYGTLEGFGSKVNWEKVNLDKDNEEQLTNTIISAEIARGRSKESAIKLAQLFKDDKKLYENAIEAKTFLSNLTKDEIKRADTLIAKQKLQQEEEEIKTWGVFVKDNKLVPANVPNSVYNKIFVDGKIKVGEEIFTLPKEIKINDNGKIIVKSSNDFFRYMYVPVPKIIDGNKVNMTEYAYDLEKELNSKTIDADILDAFIKFSKGSKEQLIKQQIEHEKIKNIRKVYTSSFGKSGDGKTAPVKKTLKLKLPVS